MSAVGVKSAKDGGKGRIEIDHVGVRFASNGNSIDAVSDVSFKVEPGEFISLIGPSGCGKSTLLNIVAGFIKPSSGQTLLDGQAIKGPGSDRGVVFQQYLLFEHMSVLEGSAGAIPRRIMVLGEDLARARLSLGNAALTRK